MGKRISSNKRLIIVTGSSGSGKTTLAEELDRRLKNSTLLTFDRYKKFMYNASGFRGYTDKERVESKAKEIFTWVIANAMLREDPVVIVEYPFDSSWENIFSELASSYGYSVITIKVKAENYDVIWGRLQERVNDPNRGVAHALENYNPKWSYKVFNGLDRENQESLYNNNTYTSINLGKSIEYISAEETSIDALISKVIGLLK